MISTMHFSLKLSCSSIYSNPFIPLHFLWKKLLYNKKSRHGEQAYDSASLQLLKYSFIWFLYFSFRSFLDDRNCSWEHLLIFFLFLSHLSTKITLQSFRWWCCQALPLHWIDWYSDRSPYSSYTWCQRFGWEISFWFMLFNISKLNDYEFSHDESSRHFSFLLSHTFLFACEYYRRFSSKLWAYSSFSR